MAQSPSENVVTIDIKPLLMPISTLLSAIIISASLLLSASILSKGGLVLGASSGNNSGAAASSASSSAAAASAPTTATTSIDNDPILGDRSKAKVAIVEFSDFECPFCQQFHQNTLGQIKKSYIDTGDVILVYRDLPLSRHEPKASFAANLMECTRKQGGDSVYYKMHDWWFQNTAANGQGVDDSKLTAYMNSIGINSADARKCANNKDFSEEIAKDTDAANAIGITGTPGFVVGKLNSDGSVTGDVISGAYPFATFQTAIEKYLN